MIATSFAEDLARFGPATAGAAPPPSVEAARAYCRRLAETHYENFTVASALLAEPLRQHFYNVYAYCRWADDLADETPDAVEALALLDWWEGELAACYAGQTRHPVFVALAETIAAFEIPDQPFRDLLVAFRRDQQVAAYATIDDLLDYCRYSANPVGRLVLYLARAHTPERLDAADAICTGLQLANFCQDVRRDAQRGRVYLPRETWDRHAVDPATLAGPTATAGMRAALTEEVARAETLLRAGLPLVERMPPAFRAETWLFAHGGLRILARIRAAGFDVWTRRPVVTRVDQCRLLLGYLGRRWFGGAAREPAR